MVCGAPTHESGMPMCACSIDTYYRYTPVQKFRATCFIVAFYFLTTSNMDVKTLDFVVA
jgi:hypothetical protein